MTLGHDDSTINIVMAIKDVERVSVFLTPCQSGLSWILWTFDGLLFIVLLTPVLQTAGLRNRRRPEVLHLVIGLMIMLIRDDNLRCML